MVPGGGVLHATLIARRLGGRWRGAMVRGPSGSGKSDLALRALSAGWRLVADDRVRVWRSGEGLYGAAPATLAGLIEARGLGLVRLAPLALARVALVVDAVPPGRTPERLPDAVFETLEGVAVVRTELDLLHASALARLDRALEAAVSGSV